MGPGADQLKAWLPAGLARVRHAWGCLFLSQVIAVTEPLGAGRRVGSDGSTSVA
jgi:hypothetical protein